LSKQATRLATKITQKEQELPNLGTIRFLKIRLILRKKAKSELKKEQFCQK